MIASFVAIQENVVYDAGVALVERSTAPDYSVLLNRKKWMTYVELATAMADYIVNFYNPLRRHSSIDYMTPDEFEALPSDRNQASTLVSVGQINGAQVR